MKELLKKFWFVLVIAVILLAGIIYFAFETNKNTVKGKTLDGENVVYTIGDKDVKASEFYDDLYEVMGTQAVAQRLQIMIIDQMVETTDELKAEADQLAENTKQQFKSQYGVAYEDALLQILKSLGYDSIEDLNSHMLVQLKFGQIINGATKDLFDDFAAEYKPRLLSHILIKMQDPENPTEEELAKVAAVDAALAEGQEFSKVASEHSEDEGSAVNSGSLGYSDKNTRFVEPFLKAALELNEGETSTWVKSEFGYHLIKCDSTSYDDMKDLQQFQDAVLNVNNEYVTEMILNFAKEHNIQYLQEGLEEEIRNVFGLGGND